MAYRPENKGEIQLNEGKQLIQQFHIQGKEVLTSCSTCHR